VSFGPLRSVVNWEVVSINLACFEENEINRIHSSFASQLVVAPQSRVQIVILIIIQSAKGDVLRSVHIGFLFVVG
jgi:hypothetical protein